MEEEVDEQLPPRWALEAAAQCYCYEANKNKELDAELVKDIVDAVFLELDKRGATWKYGDIELSDNLPKAEEDEEEGLSNREIRRLRELLDDLFDDWDETIRRLVESSLEGACDGSGNFKAEDISDPIIMFVAALLRRGNKNDRKGGEGDE